MEEAEEEAVYESSSSEEEIESEEEPEPAPAPKAKAKAVSAPQPKLSKAEKKALEMAELEAALADVARDKFSPRSLFRLGFWVFSSCRGEGGLLLCLVELKYGWHWHLQRSQGSSCRRREWYR